MKFIIRDDDVNYHYSAEQLATWYNGIIDICPVSICIPAFVKGDFFKWAMLFDKNGSYEMSDWLNDSKVYKIGDNKELVSYIKSLIQNNKASISMHGICHRNEEMEMGEVDRNHIRGAEFYTSKDYTDYVKEAKDYLEQLFGVQINSFSPPQNMINENGLKAIINNRLSLCTDPLPLRNILQCINYYGINNTLKLYYNKICYNRVYPYVIYHKIGYVFHKRLQPQVNLESIKAEFEFAYKKNGVFVLSTHSYGFDYKMTTGENLTMKEALLDILEYVKKKDNIEYTTLDSLFK